MKLCIPVPVLFLLLLLPLVSFAQTNYKKAFVVTTLGDTLHGYVDYREWEKTPRAISFRASENGGTVEEYTAGSARYFEIAGLEAYRSYEGPITMDKVNKDNLSYRRADTSVIADKVFLRILQDGANMVLYSYRDDIKERFFIADRKGDKPQELLYKRYLVAPNDVRIVEQRYYVGQLLNVARHHGILTDRLQRQIETAAYNEEVLLGVVSKLNGLSEEEIMLEKKGERGSRLFAGLALSRGTMDVFGADPFVDADENPASYMPRLAFGLDVFLNRNVQRTFLRLEAGLTNASYHLKITGRDGLSHEVTQQTASLSPQIIYNLYNKANLQLYAGGGIALNYSNYSKNTYKREPSRTIYRREMRTDFLPFWATYTARVGVIANRKYEVFAMYLAPGTVTKYVSREIKTGSMNIGVNYLFRDK